MLTFVDQKAPKVVNYASGILLYDSLGILFRAVNAADVSVRRNRHSFVDWLDRFMKFECDGQNRTNGATTHDCAFALNKTPDQEILKHNCTQYQKPFQIIRQIQEEVHPYHAVLLNDCADKTRLHMRNRIRVQLQRRNLFKICDSNSTGDLFRVLDYKMKFRSVHFREKTIENCWKRTQPWHGVMVYVRQPMGEAKNFYYGQISTVDSPQNWIAVLSIFEKIFLRLRNNFPS